jgi:hypothetical protein
MSETTEKCKICGGPYKFYPYYAGDQSACPSCVRKAEVNSSPYVRIEPGSGVDFGNLTSNWPPFKRTFTL